jgi:hypothetical protein
MRKALAFAILGAALWCVPCVAEEVRSLTRIDWQTPEQLPPRFRNHCSVGFWHNRYCSDHCGVGYQFYYCSQESFGCCHTGVGYCDWNGRLRCAPNLLPTL